MLKVLGRPLEDALRSIGEGQTPPRVVYTAAPARNGQARAEGTWRVIAIRENEWIAARFWDFAPKGKGEA